MQTYRTQETLDVKQWLHKCKTILINVPGGTTSRVQPLDVSIKKPFINYVLVSSELYVAGKLAAE